MNWSRALSRQGPTPGMFVADRGASLWELLAGFYHAAAREDSVPHRYLLLLRFVLANAVAFALLGAAAGQGWIQAILADDQGGLCRAIVAVFLVGLVWSAHRAVQLSRELNDLERFIAFPGSAAPAYLASAIDHPADSRALLASSLRLRLASRIASIRHIANSLVMLGLIGTVVGFIIALAGVRPEVASDINAIGPMVSILIGGMSVALYTTLVGSVLHVWLMVNVRLLEGGTVKLLTATIEAGERYARA
jgi:MotA/TolQ/ExbB proton channel family